MSLPATDEPTGVTVTSGRVPAVLAREPFVVLVIALYALILTFRPSAFVQSDTWLALVGGRLVAHGWLPHHDTLTVWSLGERWIDQQWLGQLLFYWLDAAGGLRLVLLFHIALLVTGFALAVTFARRTGGSARSVALVGVVGLFVALPNSVARTQSLAYVLFVATVWLLASQTRSPSRRIFLVWPLLVLWANVHGSVVLGVGLVVLWAFAEVVRRRAWARAAVVVGGAVLCLFASPYGFDLVHYYRDVFGASAFRDLVTEWGPSTLPAQLPFFVLGLGAIWLAARTPRALTLFEHLALLATFVAGLLAIRNILWFALVAVMVAPRALDGIWPPSEAPLRGRTNAMLSLGAIGLVAVSLVVAASHPAGSYAKGYPDRAANAVQAVTARDPGTRVFANETFADWLLWRTPSLAGRVAFDARLELLDDHELHSIAAFRRRSTQPSLAAADGYRLLVLDPRTEKRAIRAIRAEPGTRQLFRNDDVVVLLRSATR